MQMLSQLGSMAGQLPQMLMQIPQQMMQPLQQLSQPLQQLTSMFGQGGKADSMGAAGTAVLVVLQPPAGRRRRRGRRLRHGARGIAARLRRCAVTDAVDGESGGRR